MNRIKYTPKPKLCAYPDCGEQFINYNSIGKKYCSYACEAKHLTELEIDKKIEGFAENLKDHQYWTKKLQEIFNEFIRLRDKSEPCISCGTTAKCIYHAGHFYAAGNYPALRFNEDNVHKQCGFNCNTSKHGNTAEYSKRLILKIGTDRFDRLFEIRNIPLKLSIPELKQKIEHYKNEVKKLKSTN